MLNALGSVRRGAPGGDQPFKIFSKQLVHEIVTYAGFQALGKPAVVAARAQVIDDAIQVIKNFPEPPLGDPADLKQHRPACSEQCICWIFFAQKNASKKFKFKRLFANPYPLDGGGPGINVPYSLASKIPEKCPVHFFRL